MAKHPARRMAAYQRIIARRSSLQRNQQLWREHRGSMAMKNARRRRHRCMALAARVIKAVILWRSA